MSFHWKAQAHVGPFADRRVIVQTMNSTAALTGAHLRTYNTIFQHPLSHNLGWLDVQALLREIAQVETEPNGNLKVTRNGQMLVISPPRTKDIAEVDDLMAVRHFLERSAVVPPVADPLDAHWLLVIDHHEARLFRSEMHGTIPEQILAHGSDGPLRHANPPPDFARGGEKPSPHSFFALVTKALPESGKILVFGTGTGRSNEMDQFVAWLKIHHADKAGRIIGTVVVDEHHLTTDQLLAKAREFYVHDGKARR